MRIQKVLLAALTIALLAVAGALALLSGAASSGGAAPSGPSSGSGYKGMKLDKPAPAFTLTDQRGNEVSLADHRGKVVVLTLLDPHCTDICPVYANHYRLAYDALDEEQKQKVVFLAFNANNKKTSVEAIKAATQKWRLDKIPSFHFLTGNAEQLEKVWDAYNLEASGAPKPDNPGELQHSPAIYLIDQSGQLRRYLSTNFEGAPLPSALIVDRAKSLIEEGQGWW